jgi:hypothetical protein
MTMEECDPTTQDWSNAYGQEFTPEELKDARDFHDLAGAYCLDNEWLMAFLNERKLRLGHRLYLAMMLEPDQLGIICLKDDDDRIVKIAKARCGEIEREKDGRSSIILPGEEAVSVGSLAPQPEKKAKGKIIIP